MCQVCQQTENPGAGTAPSRLEPGEREYRGYQEWAVHPEEARFLLHRGYALVDGERRRVWWIHNEAYVTQIRVEGTDQVYALEERYWQSSEVEHVVV